MNKTEDKDTAGKAPKKEWMGYTLEELQTRRLITQAKIGLATSRLKKMEEDRKAAEQASIYTRVSNYIDYIGYGVKAYRIIRKLLSWRKKK